MQQFLQRHKKLLTISISIVSSVFLVALVVTAATTIGASITTGGNITPTSDNTGNLGAYGTAWKNVYASGTIFAGHAISNDFLAVGDGTSTSTIRGGASVTSTFTSGVQIKEASATSTLSIGNLTGAVNQGGCIALGTGDGANGALFLWVDATGNTPYLATSTNPDDCF